MKYYNSIFTLMICAFSFVGCNYEGEEFVTMNPNEGTSRLYTYPLDFDVSCRDNDTRATDAGVWENGDVVFMSLNNNGSQVWGSAVYDKPNNIWTLSCNEPLSAASDAACTAWYGKGVGNETNTTDYVAYDYLSAAFSTTDGRWSFSNNVVRISATMTPYRRLRFKGTVGTTISVKGDSHLECLYAIHKNSGSGFYRHQGFPTELTVKSNGYTDYFVYYIDSDNTNIILTNLSSGQTYQRYFNHQTLLHGESGCFTIPTESDLHGWVMNQEADHDYIDLGLPSGTLWATCNIGASKPTQAGYYFAWGELSEKSEYTWESYEGYQADYDLCPDYGSDISGTSHDAAYMLWGGPWRMPSKSEVDELRLYCTWTLTTMNGIEGFEVKSTQNNNSIFLPLTGYRGNDGEILDKQKRGDYWTSSLDPSDPKQAFYIGFTSSQSYVYTDNQARFVGRVIRPIQGGHPVSHDYVDLGIKDAHGSTTFWATSNIGAVKPEDSGLYFAWGETIGYTSDVRDGHTFNWANYKYCNGSSSTITKYYKSDGKTQLDPEDDAASAYWGGAWRIPTKDELDQLQNNCNWQWTTQNGVQGYRVSNKNDSNKYIFLPAAGVRTENEFTNYNSSGVYWTSTLSDKEGDYCAYAITFDNGGYESYDSRRFNGRSVRAVFSTIP